MRPGKVALVRHPKKQSSSSPMRPITRLQSTLSESWKISKGAHLSTKSTKGILRIRCLTWPSIRAIFKQFQRKRSFQKYLTSRTCGRAIRMWPVPLEPSRTLSQWTKDTGLSRDSLQSARGSSLTTAHEESGMLPPWFRVVMIHLSDQLIPGRQQKRKL